LAKFRSGSSGNGQTSPIGFRNKTYYNHDKI
jgi:hypothetical protein